MPLSRVENPERVLIIQPRVGPQGLPWVSRQRRTTLKGLKRWLLKSCCNPFRVGLFLTSTQGRRFRANPGLSDCHPFRMAYTAYTVHNMLKCSKAFSSYIVAIKPLSFRPEPSQETLLEGKCLPRRSGGISPKKMLEQVPIPPHECATSLRMTGF